MKKLIIFTGIATAVFLALKASNRLDANKANSFAGDGSELSLTEGGGGVKNGLLGEEAGLGGDAGSSARGGFTV